MAPCRLAGSAALAAFLLSSSAAQGSAAAPEGDDDDECAVAGTEACTLSMLQRRGAARQLAVAGGGPPSGTQGGGPGAATLVGTGGQGPAGAADDQEMMAIITEAFSGVRGPGGYLKTNRKIDETWKMCGMVDWSVGASAALNSGAVDAGKKELGISDFCKEDAADTWDDTCRAIQGVVESTRRLLQRFPRGPRFSNAFVVNWGRFQSWSSGSVSPVNWTAKPPSAQVHNRSGIVGYAICNIVRTVLTQSPNQQSAGICSHVASLGALSKRAPAKALEMAVRLLWTGRHTPQAAAPCDYIFKRQPGLVPWKDINSTWVPPAAAAHFVNVSLPCTGNAADCENTRGSPIQPAGLAYMWSAAAIGEAEAANGGSCDGRHVYALNYPGLQKATIEQNGGDQGGNTASMLWSCNQFIDPKKKSCRFDFNEKACGGLPLPLCKANFNTYLPMFARDVLTRWMTDLSDAQGFEAMNLTEGEIRRGDLTNLRRPGPYVPPLWAEAWRGQPSFLRARAEAILASMGGLAAGIAALAVPAITGKDLADQVPTATEAQLRAACAADVALLLVDNVPIQGIKLLQDNGINYTGQIPFYGLGANEPLGNTTEEKVAIASLRAGMDGMYHTAMVNPHGQCNHAVYLSSCDEAANEYRVWSWGYYTTLTREMMLGIPVKDHAGPANTGLLCGSVLADQITWADSDVVA